MTGYSQVFRSGNLLLRQPSNSHYCVSLRQLAVALTINGLGGNKRGAMWIFLLSSIFRFSIAVSGLVLQHRK